ncbi:dynamin family protein [Fusobacterium varium]|uniref:dynamin family protein n=1 Tax=Fusobacterium varium TaxID=856 RepID=UPI00356552B0
MEKEKLGISQYIDSHIIMREKEKFKIGYLNLLEYFLKKYSSKDIYNKELFKLYIKKLVKESEYKYNEEKLKEKIKVIKKIKFKNYKFFTYKYFFLIDCLYINSFLEEDKAKEIITELKQLFNKKESDKMDQLYNILYRNKSSTNFFIEKKQIEYWNKNKLFYSNDLKKILITANMSAGKSTLINALIGKKVTHTKNEACTSRIINIYSKAYDDQYDYKWEAQKLNLEYSKDEFEMEKQENLTSDKNISTYFYSKELNKGRICLIDTPGVNFSMDTTHREIAFKIIQKREFNKLIYVLNSENIGTDDDNKWLKYIVENVDREKLIFVVNKFDKYRSKEDSISETVEEIKKDLKKIGIDKPIVCPISAYAGFLAKKCLTNQELNEDEKDELEYLARKLNKNEYNLLKFYNHTMKVVESENKYEGLLRNSGIMSLEELILNN